MRWLILIAFCVGAFSIVVFANDPNTLVKPPMPGTENISVVNSKTLRITTSRDIKKDDLLSEKQNLEARLAIVNARLAAFK